MYCVYLLTSPSFAIAGGKSMNPLSFLLYRATLKLTSLYWVKVILQRWVELFFFDWMVWLSFNFYVDFISFIHYFIVILSWVYNQPAQWPAPSRLVSSIYCRALYRFKGQGLESCTSLYFFFRLSFRNCRSCVYNCNDLFSFNSWPCSSSLWY